MRNNIDIRHSGTLTAERTRLTLDQDALAHLMSVLTDLYSDPALAVGREYSSNALDSHLAAGNPAPIEITLPNDFEPTFTVRDYGVGMDEFDVLTNFSRYGWSSKRDNDIETGMLGLGCKAGLAYTSQFTLVAVKDSVKTTFLVTREEDGAGALQSVHTIDTDEPNGVTVTIPVKRPVQEFNRKIRDFFRFWEPGTVLVDGEPPVYIGDVKGVLELDPDILLLPVGNLSQNYVVMGNVPYPCVTALGSGPFYKTVARVPMGSVSFTPSREALQDSKRTTDTVDTIKEFVTERLQRHVQNYVDESPNATEALRRVNALCQLPIDEKKLRYDYTKIPEYVDRPLANANACLWYKGHDRATIIGGTSRIFLHDVLDKLHVVGYRRRGLITDAKTLIVDHMTKSGFKGDTTFVYAENFGSPWLDTVEKITLEELAGPQKPRVTRERHWKLFNGIRTVTVSESTLAARPGQIVVCDQALVGIASQRQNVHWTLKHVSDTDISLVLVPTDKMDQFRAAFPAARMTADAIREHLVRLAAEMTERDLAAMSNIDDLSRFHMIGDADKFLDPDMRRLIKLARNSSERVSKWIELSRLSTRFSVTVARPVHPEVNELRALTREVKQRYPMIASSSYHYSNFHDYCNALWLLRNKYKDPMFMTKDA